MRGLGGKQGIGEVDHALGDWEIEMALGLEGVFREI